MLYHFDGSLRAVHDAFAASLAVRIHEIGITTVLSLDGVCGTYSFGRTTRRLIATTRVDDGSLF